MTCRNDVLKRSDETDAITVWLSISDVSGRMKGERAYPAGVLTITITFTFTFRGPLCHPTRTLKAASLGEQDMSWRRWGQKHIFISRHENRNVFWPQAFGCRHSSTHLLTWAGVKCGGGGLTPNQASRERRPTIVRHATWVRDAD